MSARDDYPALARFSEMDHYDGLRVIGAEAREALDEIEHLRGHLGADAPSAKAE
jgi:hypothetical protein